MKKFARLLTAFLSLVVSISAIPTTANAEFDKTSYDFVKQMTVGYSIGNTLDAPSTSETAWGCPKITRNLVKAIYNKGFDVIRIPITWYPVIDSNGNFKDSNARLNRVKEVVDWAYNTGAYVIINTHHEMSWLNTWASIKNSDETDVDSSKETAMVNKFGTLWKNIANKFKDYGERLIFEGYNETRDTESNWAVSKEASVTLQKIGQKFVDVVRSTGGNNSKRYLLLNTYGAVCKAKPVQLFQMPSDSANHLIIGVHTYDPQKLCFRDSSTTTFDESAMKEIFDSAFKQLKDLYLSKGIGVIMGEMGAVNKNNNSERIKYVNSLVSYCSNYSTIPVWWDSGFTDKSNSVDAFGLINRSSCSWVHNDIALALVNKSKELKSSRPSLESFTATTTTTTQPTTTTTHPTAITTTEPSTTTQPTTTTITTTQPTTTTEPPTTTTTTEPTTATRTINIIPVPTLPQEPTTTETSTTEPPTATTTTATTTMTTTQPTTTRTVNIIPVPTLPPEPTTNTTTQPDTTTTTTTTTTTITTKPRQMCGDLNNDKTINSYDIMLIKFILANKNANFEIPASADINNDGVVNSFDVMLVKMYIVESKK